MSSQLPDTPPPSPPKAKKAVKIEARVDPDMARDAAAKAAKMGWTLSSVIRALLATWLQEDVVHANEVGDAAKRAPRGPNVKKPRKEKGKPK